MPGAGRAAARVVRPRLARDGLGFLLQQHAQVLSKVLCDALVPHEEAQAALRVEHVALPAMVDREIGRASCRERVLR